MDILEESKEKLFLNEYNTHKISYKVSDDECSFCNVCFALNHNAL